jgi:tryptophan synthase alpha chain
MLWYPHKQWCLDIVAMIVRHWVTHLELGIPFSDPSADGPLLTWLNHEMVTQDNSIDYYLNIVEEIINKHPQLSLCIMTYANPVYHYGVDRFCKHLEDIGVDSLLIPDLPIHEERNFYPQDVAIKRTHIVSDNLDDTSIIEIAWRTTGFLYVMTQVATTGDHTFSITPLASFVIRLRKLLGCHHRLIAGFSIKTAQDVSQIQMLDLDGYIIGSELVRQYQSWGIAQLESFISKL